MKTKVISKPNLIVAKNRQKEVTNFHYLDNTVSDFIKEYAKGKFYFIRTYGCQANVRDEETMSGMLDLVGMNKVDEAKDAGVDFTQEETFKAVTRRMEVLVNELEELLK